MRQDQQSRVAESHQIARTAFAAALVFAIVAVVWGVVALATDGPWWGPLHAFLAGTVLLAISGASQMFTITWSSTRPPTRAATSAQRWLVISGVAAVLLGMAAHVSALIWIGGLTAAAGVVVLAGNVYGAVRRSLLRRFDLSARFYLTAFACGVVGIVLGTVMGTGSAGVSFETLRLAHSHLNLVGLVGLTIIGTLPTLLPTTAYHRAVSGTEAVWAWRASVVGAVFMTGGVLVPRLVGAGSLLVAVAGLIILIGIVVRLPDEGRHKLPFLQITLGASWLLGWALADAISVLGSGTMPHFAGWTAAAVVGGVGQVLAGSLAYLVPVLKGSPFVENRRIMQARSWLPLLSVNLAAIAIGLRLGPTAVAALAVWVIDFLVRLGRVWLTGSVPDDPEQPGRLG